MLPCLKLNFIKQKQLPRLFSWVSFQCHKIEIRILAYVFLSEMCSGCLLLQIVWGLKTGLKTLNTTGFSTHRFSPLGIELDWLHKSFCKARTEPKDWSAQECSCQVD